MRRHGRQLQTHQAVEGPSSSFLRAFEFPMRSLAQFYTSKIKYDPDRFAGYSEALRQALAARGFLP